ncbi:MAG: TolC family protein [Byssovorax sp.]
MRTSPLALVLVLPLLAAPAAAQPPPAAPRPKPPLPTAAPAPKPPAPAAAPLPGRPARPAAQATPGTPPTEPPPLPKVDVEDPALGPVAPAPHMLGGWKDALSMINSRSIDLLIAQQDVLRNEGAYQQALSGALPLITGNATISQNLISSTNPFTGATNNTPVATTQITASQPIFALQTWYNVKTADLNTRAAKLTVEDKRRLVLSQVAAAIISVFTAERIAEINRVSLRNALQHQSLAERKSRLGDGTRLDVLRAQQDATTTRATLIAGDESLRKAREVLGLALGEPDGYGVPPTISLNEMAQAISSTCSPGTLDQRADIAAARTAVDAASRGVTASRLAYIPTAQVSSTLQASSDTLSSGKNVAWSIQGVLTVPIWDGNLKAGAVRIARASEEQAKLKLELARRGATLDVQQAMRAVSVAEQARIVSEQNRDLAREAARLAERAFAAGAATSFDLVDASRQERAAELDLTVKEFNLIQAKVTAMLTTANCTY